MRLRESLRDFDQKVAFNTQFSASDVSTRDYFHPSIAREAKLPAVSWNYGYWGSGRCQ